LSLQASRCVSSPSSRKRARSIPYQQVSFERPSWAVVGSDFYHCRQHPLTAKGFASITLEDEDEDGLMNVIVKPDVHERRYRVLRNCLLMMVEGTIQKQPGVLNLLAHGAVG